MLSFEEKTHTYVSEEIDSAVSLGGLFGNENLKSKIVPSPLF